jgi:hypothetical protein
VKEVLSTAKEMKSQMENNSNNLLVKSSRRHIVGRQLSSSPLVNSLILDQLMNEDNNTNEIMTLIKATYDPEEEEEEENTDSDIKNVNGDGENTFQL